LLLEAFVEKAAKQRFNQEVICTPCAFGSGSVSIGWQIESKQTAEVIAYMPLVTGSFMEFPSDFEYGVTTVVPLSKKWARVFNFKVRFIAEEIEICKCK
jgi:hypothetical protein